MAAMRRWAWVGVLAVVLAVTGGCAAAESDESPEPTVNATTSGPRETVPAAESGADEALPSRAEMDEATRILAEAVFLQTLREEPGLAAVSDDVLVAAGDAGCDAMDRGDSLQSVLIVVAAMATGASDTDSIAILTGVASGVLCPEHADYTG